uniref:Uncharacterized protein n=1 Tax=Kalanchoe fedtschenkoi TaxID=63787 RepID=A0A7N0T152_KALFE
MLEFAESQRWRLVEVIKERKGNMRIGSATYLPDHLQDQIVNNGLPIDEASGVRVLMLHTYDFLGDVWLCHSFKGKCHNFTAFEPARDTLVEVEAFLSATIVTLILEDYVTSPNGLTNVFKATGLMKYWFPLSKMPRQGGDWPLVKDMIAANHRLIVFTSIESKEQSEGIAYQWNFMVENPHVSYTSM